MSDTTNAVATGKKRSNSVISVAIDGEDMIFRVLGQPDLILKTGNANSQLRERAMFHGFKQRVSDAAAIPADPTTGRPASASEKWEAMKQIVDHLNSGASEWNVKRAEGGRDTSGLVMHALANLKGKTITQLETQLGQMAAKSGVEVKDLLKKLSQSADIIREIAAIKAARVNVDADAMLAELE